MRIFLVFYSAALLIALTDAQRKLNTTKPVVNLEKRPRPVWHRPPEERRKLSIFPRNNIKFIVTPKTVKNDEAKEGLPIKRPLMRKFVMQDKNAKGTWSFAPRDPLMKTQRFTVTLAPTKASHNQGIDEMKPEESKKEQTVISNVKSETKSSKPHTINKKNFIEIVTMKNDLFASKNLQNIERNLTVKNFSETIKINDTQNFQIVQMPDNKTLPTFGEFLIDVRSFNDDGVILENNATTNQDQDGYNTLNKTTESSNIESRAPNLNDMTNPINQNENNSLIIHSVGSNNHKTGQVLHINDLEILLEKIVNNTEQSNNNSTLDLKDNRTLLFITPNNENSITINEIPQIDVTRPNTFYDVVSLSKLDKENTNLVDDLFTASIILNTTNDKKHSVSEINALNDKDNLTEHVADTLVMGNMESLINFVENNTVGTKNTVKIQGNDVKYKDEFKISDADLTAEYTTSQSLFDEITSQYAVNVTEVEHQTKPPAEFNKTDSNNGSDSHDLSLEIYESNMPLSSDEISIECDEFDSHEPTPSNLNVTKEETSNEELIDNSNSSSLDEISNMSTSDTSNYYAEERSNESLIDKSNNLTNEQISNESYSNITGEDLSGESYANKLTEEIPSESSVELSTNYTGEQFSNESSSNMAAEELSYESYYVDKPNDLTGEISSDFTTDYSSNSSQQIPNESSSATAEEEISNESYLTDETSKEGLEASNNFTEELTSNESSSNVAGEETSNEFYLTDDISNESIESSNHFRGEQTSNVSFNLSGGDIANVSKESIETFNNFTGEEDLIDNIDYRVSAGQTDSSHDRSVEEIPEEALINRFKRSNNIIEEENMPTTVSGFRYTGLEVKLNQDSRYKNINA